MRAIRVAPGGLHLHVRATLSRTRVLLSWWPLAARQDEQNEVQQQRDGPEDRDRRVHGGCGAQGRVEAIHRRVLLSGKRENADVCAHFLVLVAGSLEEEAGSDDAERDGDQERHPEDEVHDDVGALGHGPGADHAHGHVGGAPEDGERGDDDEAEKEDALTLADGRITVCGNGEGDQRGEQAELAHDEFCHGPALVLADLGPRGVVEDREGLG